MFNEVKIINLMSAMAHHASRSHSVIAENVANADTPGYKAKQVESFSDVYARAQRTDTDLKTIAPKIHLAPTGDIQSPNGNSVSLEEQMMQASLAKANHDLAMEVYKKSLSFLKMSVGKNL